MLGPAAMLAVVTPSVAPVAEPAIVAAARPRLNPTKRVLRFVVPLTDGGVYRGDVELAIDPDDRLSVKAARLLQILEPVLKPEIHAQLKARAGSADTIDEAALAALQITLTYDSQNLALAIGIPVPARRTAALSLRLAAQSAAATLEPAPVSGFLNIRMATDIVMRGGRTGVQAPVAGLDGAVRLFGLVAEGEGVLSFRRTDPRFRWTGGRLVYDDTARLVRLSVGDARPFGRGFQSSGSVAGLSISRSYGLLDPSREIRSTGAQSFTVLAPSSVETIVNGRTVERRTLQPGSYTLADFPLAEGANDVKLRIIEEAGREREIAFSLYSNRQLLDPGATEFWAFAGVYSEPARNGFRYTDAWTFQGFVRKGLGEQVSAGLNLQADADAQQAGLEALVGSRFGLIGLDLAASRRRTGAAGVAASLGYEKIIGQGAERQHAVRAALEYRSAHFAMPGALVPRESQQLRASLGYALTLGFDRFLALDLRYGRDRVAGGERYGARVSGGLRLADTVSAIAEIAWDRGLDGQMVAGRIGIRTRFGARATAQLDMETGGTVRALYQAAGGEGIGAWSTSADLTRTTDATALNATGNYIANRGELAINQLATFDPARRRVSDMRTTVRLGTALAFAGGRVAIGRPVQDAFLIADPHRSLAHGQLRVDPQGRSAGASSGALGPALTGALSAYSPRLLVYDVPEAPPGYDLGAGNVQLVPPYKSGYRLQVGSDYHLLVIGRLLGRDGQPVSLLAGKATDLAAPKRPAVTLFTSRGGRFGAQGLRPGRWRIEMPTEGGATTYEFVVNDDPGGTVTVGDLHPLEKED